MLVMQPLVVVVGAGIAGLTCARELKRRGVPGVVLERSPLIGGRCASLDFGGLPVDHGTPFLHAESREFALELDALPEAGKVRGWPLRVREAHPGRLPPGLRGQRRMARRAGVAEFPASLARDLDVRCATGIVSLASEKDQIRITLADGATITAPFVALATAIDDALRLIDPLVRSWPGASSPLDAIRRLRQVPALTLVARYPAVNRDPGFDLWRPSSTSILGTVIHEGGKRGEVSQSTFVFHARELFSREYLERDRDEWASEMLWEAGQLLGSWAARPVSFHAHVWTCARLRPGQSMGEVVTFETGDGGCVSLCGDAFAAQTGIEGAYLSGIALGEQIATLPRVRDQVRV
jgi:predicted NAD/FAD-dependent oxidoreductase